MPPRKKTESKAEEVVSTDVHSPDEPGVRENPPGLAEALKGPTTADLNPAFND